MSTVYLCDFAFPSASPSVSFLFGFLVIGSSILLRLPVRKPPGLIVNLDHTMSQSVEGCVRRLGHPTVSDLRVTVLFWDDGPVTLDQCLKMKPWQFMNHFPGTFAIANKVALARNIEKLQKWFPDLYNFHPKSFALPTQLSHLKMLLGGSLTYIMKPALGSGHLPCQFIQFVTSLL
jgi:hypothetical protein